MVEGHTLETRTEPEKIWCMYFVCGFIVPHVKQKRDMYCFFAVVDGGIHFFVFRSFFSETRRARAMKLGSCIHLEE